MKSEQIQEMQHNKIIWILVKRSEQAKERRQLRNDTVAIFMFKG